MSELLHNYGIIDNVPSWLRDFRRALLYSTPELDTVTNNLIQGMQMMDLCKPPPPYPINRPSSNSTPDLASQTAFAHHSHYIISSPVSNLCYRCA